jgi:hypothetical protein
LAAVREAFRSHRLLQRRGVDRQLPHALVSRSKDRVGDREDDRLGSGFAHPAGQLRTLDDMDLDRRRFVDPRHLVSVEVGLLDTLVLERDCAVERGGDPEDDRALDLRPDDIGIDHNAAIDRADDARPLPSRPSYGSSSIRPPS